MSCYNFFFENVSQFIAYTLFVLSQVIVRMLTCLFESRPKTNFNKEEKIFERNRFWL